MGVCRRMANGKALSRLSVMCTAHCAESITGPCRRMLIYIFESHCNASFLIGLWLSFLRTIARFPVGCGWLQGENIQPTWLYIVKQNV